MVTCEPFIHGTLLTQAFELCKCGDSNNLSHSSLTSSSTLTTLCLLPQTNATLYAEFTGANSSPDDHINAETDKSFSDEESPFITKDADEPPHQICSYTLIFSLFLHFPYIADPPLRTSAPT